VVRVNEVYVLFSPRLTNALVAGATLILAPALVSRTAQSAGPDRVRTTRGSEAGEITDMTPLEVTIDKGTSGTRKVAINEIVSITFHDEPTELTQARVNAKNGGFVNASELLQKVDVSKVDRDYVKQDVDFYQALAAANLALRGTGEINAAGSRLNEFVRKYRQSFHYWEAVETMGDLLAASEKFDAAQKQYAELAKAPWPEYQMRADVALGRALEADGKHDEAVQQFDAALAVSDDSEAGKAQKLSATLGKAVSVAATGHIDDAAKSIEEVVANADPEQKELQARAYNALGSCYEKAGKTKEALLAFLHVDVLYSTVPDAHAEALSHLVGLWQAVGQDARSREARQTLQEKYANSKWAKSAAQ
jgi:tetratricopeptide (TPR) repeat protein